MGHHLFSLDLGKNKLCVSLPKMVREVARNGKKGNSKIRVTLTNKSLTLEKTIGIYHY